MNDPPASARYTISIATGLADDLAQACLDVAELLRGTSALDDPLAHAQRGRLLPDAYRDDPEASAEFRRYVENDLVDRKAGAAERIAATIAAAHVGDDDVDDERGTTTITLDSQQLIEWAGAITDVRLVLAEELNIASDDDTVRLQQSPGDPVTRELLGRYEWLAIVQEQLVQALLAELPG